MQDRPLATITYRRASDHARRAVVPEGPLWDAWNAPNGGAVKLSVAAMKMEARWLRRARPRPFGFAPGSGHPVPERIGEAHAAGTLTSVVASLLGFRTLVWTMSIVYGDLANPVAPAAEITPDFDPEDEDADLEQDTFILTTHKHSSPSRHDHTPRTR